MKPIEAVAAFDATVEHKLDAIRSPAVDTFMYGLSSAADHSLLWHTANVARALAGSGDVDEAVRFSLALGLESAITNGPVKSLFRRVRPAEYADIAFHRGLRRPITSSFPSGHATAGFLAASLLGGGPFWFGAATAVATTRVYVRLHHASDVVAGAAFGLGLAAVLKPFVKGAFVKHRE